MTSLIVGPISSVPIHCHWSCYVQFNALLALVSTCNAVLNLDDQVRYFLSARVSIDFSLLILKVSFPNGIYFPGINEKISK